MKLAILTRFALATLMVASCCSTNIYAQSSARETTVQAAGALSQWLGTGENARRWNAYLKTSVLNAELAKGAAADPAVLDDLLTRLQSSQAGLELPRFERLASAIEAWKAELVASQPIDKLIAEAKSSFKPATQADFEAARAKLLAATKKLDSYLNGLGPNGVAWKQYLHWDEMQSQIAAGLEAKTIVLREISIQYFTDHIGLEMPQFTAVGTALRQYANALYAVREANLNDQYPAKLDELTKQINAYDGDPSEANAAAIASQLSWLDRNGQPTRLLAAIRQRYTKPNLYAHVSEALIAHGTSRQLNEATPLDDYILGTHIQGMGRTVGRLDTFLVPDTHRATIDMKLTGTTYSKSVGSNRSALIYNKGVTQISGTKRVWFDELGIHETPSYADAKTNSQITGIGSTRGGILGCVVVKVATKKAAESKGQGEAIGSEHAKARISHRLDEEAAKQLATSNRDWKLKFRDPLKRSNVYPQLIRFTSTSNFLNVAALSASQTQLGAPNDPPTLSGNFDLNVVVHESLVNNAVANMFAGRTLTDEQIRAEVLKRRGSLPDEMKNLDDKEPFSFTFADEQPVSLQIADGGFRVTIRGKRFTSGERKFKPMNITATYKAERNGIGLKLVRQGDLEIFPPGFNRTTDRFPIDQVALRSILQKKFGKMFKPEIVGEGLELPGKYKSLGKLPLADYQLAKGWAALGWKRDTARLANTGAKAAR